MIQPTLYNTPNATNAPPSTEPGERDTRRREPKSGRLYTSSYNPQYTAAKTHDTNQQIVARIDLSAQSKHRVNKRRCSTSIGSTVISPTRAVRGDEDSPSQRTMAHTRRPQQGDGEDQNRGLHRERNPSSLLYSAALPTVIVEVSQRRLLPRCREQTGIYTWGHGPSVWNPAWRLKRLDEAVMSVPSL